MSDKRKDITQRMNYFDRQFLQAEDFNLEQEYHIDRRRRHNCYMHTPGIGGNGLELIEAKDNDGNKVIKITAGTAYDLYGREIVVSEAFAKEYVVDTSRIKLKTTGYVTIQYHEEPAGEHVFGVSGRTRWSEIPIISITPTNTDPEVKICLGKISHDGVGVFTIHNEERKYAGTKASNLNNLNQSQFDEETKGLLVTGGNSHDHTGGKGGKIKHSSLDLDGKTNPHGITAEIIDKQGGSNKIVDQINKGTGVINKKNIEKVTVDDIDKDVLGNVGLIVGKINTGNSLIDESKIKKSTSNTNTVKKGWIKLPAVVNPIKDVEIKRRIAPFNNVEFQISNHSAFDNCMLYSFARNAEGTVTIPIYPGVTKLTGLRFCGYQNRHKLTYQLYKFGLEYISTTAQFQAQNQYLIPGDYPLSPVLTGIIEPGNNEISPFNYVIDKQNIAISQDESLVLYLKSDDIDTTEGYIKLFFLAVEFEYGL